MRYILSLMFVSVLILASCAPNACTNCHLTNGLQSPTLATDDPCGLLAEGFSQEVGTVFTVESGNVKTILHWNSNTATLTSDDGLVRIEVPDNSRVTPASWPKGFEFLSGVTLANCDGGLHLKMPAQAHIIK